MKPQYLLLTALMAGACLAMPSCSDDFLNLTPKSNMNEEDFYKSEADFGTARTSAYATLYNEYGPECGPSFTELLSDECETKEGKVLITSTTGSNSDVYPFTSYALEPSNTVVKHIWQTGYADLNVINKTLDKLVASTDFAATKTGKGYQAELRFLRALYHFNLVREFGEIPIADHSLTVNESRSLNRSDISDVYTFILNDLKYAVENLPLKSETTQGGQITKGAAETCLGEVYLTLGDKASAATALKDVIDSKQYALVDNYADLWSMNHKNCPESILEVQYVAGAGNPSSPYFEAYAPYENFSITAQGYGLNQVTDRLYDSYEAGDVRRDISISTSYKDRSGKVVPAKYENKWFDPNYIKNGSYYYGNNFIVYRYADVLLMYAEATGDASYLNQVRHRVGLPGFGEAGYPSDKYPTLALAIEHERNVELALEFHRWYDLKRTGRATTLLTDAKGKAITEDMLVLPVPLVERQVNPGLTQNAYYEKSK